MKVTPKVAWSEGVLILPQHLQQIDTYHEHLVASRLDAFDACSWGVLAIDLDEHALGQQRVALRRFEGVLPDGTVLSLGDQVGQHPLPPVRSLEGLFPPSRTSLSVFLGVPQERVGLNNYTTETEELRYAVSLRSVFDQARDDNNAEVELAVPNAVLLFGDEAQVGDLTIKIAEIERNGSGGFVFASSYVAPCLRFNAAPALCTELKRLLALVVSRYRVLSESRRQAGQARIEFNAGDITRFLQLNALSGLLPSMNYLNDYGDVHPRTAFLLLAQGAGQLATFSPDEDMSQSLRFDYRDLRATFGTLFGLLDRLARQTDTEQYVSCTLRLHKDRYVGDLSDERMARCRRYLFAVESNLPRPQVVEEFSTKAKVASHEDIDIVTARAIVGVPVEECKHPPAQVPIKPGVVYFDVTVDKDQVYWKHVWKDNNVVVCVPSLFDAERTSIRLLGLLEAYDGR